MLVYVITPIERTSLSHTWSILASGYFSELKQKTGIEFKHIFIRQYSIDLARNEGVKKALKDGAGYVLFLDDDVVPYTAEKILYLFSAEVPVACGIYREKRPKGGVSAYFMKKRRVIRMSYGELKSKGHLVPVDACATGFLLVHSSVFEVLKSPWFSLSKNMGEDIRFTWRVRKEVGVRPVAVTGATAYHLIGGGYVFDVDGNLRFMSELF